MRYSGEYPEHMICRAIQALEEILRYFLLKGKKPGKRLNVKFGFMRGDSGVYDHPFTAKFADGEIRDIRRIQSNAYPISEWTPWDKNDCRYLYIYKNWETEGFAKESAKSHECLMQEPEPPRITIKHIWEIN